MPDLTVGAAEKQKKQKRKAGKAEKAEKAEKQKNEPLVEQAGK